MIFCDNEKCYNHIEVFYTCNDLFDGHNGQRYTRHERVIGGKTVFLCSSCIAAIKMATEIQIGPSDGAECLWFCPECDNEYKAKVGDALPCPHCGAKETNLRLIDGKPELWRERK